VKNNEKTYSFLKSNGFELIQKDTSAFFGDYYDTFSNGSFQLRLSSSKSFETVDIRSNLPSENWYDLALVKALLYGEKNLNNITTIEEHRGFLQKELTNIAELFNDRNYPATKKRLEELGNERAEQMFPGIRIVGRKL
jgi:hypothetical protein